MADAACSRAPAPSGTIAIRDHEFRLFQSFMFDSAGVTLSSAKKALVSGRLGRRLSACGCRSFTDYYQYIRRDGEERQRAIDLLTTNETYFFREPKHFDFLRETILPGLGKGASLRVWSAASSSGEEAYSLAMVLADAGLGLDWSILGSDLSTQVLEKARSGHYPLTRIEGISRAFLQQYCLKGKGTQAGTFLIQRELRQRTEFRQINLNASLPPLELFDVIFLRNVLIYFSAETKAQVVRRVLGVLKPGGYLFVGHSESLHGIATGMIPVRPSVYLKPV